MSKKLFVIEFSTTQDNNPQEYRKVALDAAKAIIDKVPSAHFLFNKVPKEHAMSDIYCQLIPNDDE